MEGREVTLELLGTNEQEIAYLAGFFDGEGCIWLARWNYLKADYYSLRSELDNTFPEPLYLARRIFGGKVRLTKQRGNRNPVHKWVVGSRKAETFLRVLLPYLIIKKAEATLALELPALRRVKSPRKADLARQIKALKSKNRLSITR